MIVDRIAIGEAADGFELSARVRPDDQEESVLRFRVPARFAPPAVDASPFVPALLLRCMGRGEDLTIDGPVSPQLLAATPEAMAVYRAFWPHLVRPVVVRATAQQEPPPGRGELGVFFTRGIDSWFTTLAARSAGEDPELIYAPDLDTWYDDEGRELAIKQTAAAATGLGKDLVTVGTNLRWFTEPVLHYGYTQGGILASIGLVLGLRETRINSNRSFGEQSYGRAPGWGASPLLDHLFSTERSRIVHWGAQATRLQKVRVVAADELALSSLKVCFDRNLETNCGRCRKCMITMAELHVAGALRKGQHRFDAPLDPARMGTVVPADEFPHNQYLELLPELGASRFDRRLARSIRKLLIRTDLRRVRDHLSAMWRWSQQRAGARASDGRST